MKHDKHTLLSLMALGIAAALSGLAWDEVLQGTRAMEADAAARAVTALESEAAGLATGIGWQIEVLDQKLRFMAAAWQTDPARFDIAYWQHHSAAPDEHGDTVFLADRNGLVRQSTLADINGQNIAGMDCFRALSDGSAQDIRPYIGPAAADGIIRQRHMNIARALRTADGTFAGVINTGLPVASLLDTFGRLALGTQGFAALIGTDDGRLRAARGSATAAPASLSSEISIAGTPMFRVMRRGSAASWTGASPVDAVRRIHVFHAIPGHDLAVVVAMEEQEAMAPANRWRRQALLLAASLTVLLFSTAVLLAAGAHRTHRRAVRIAADRATLAASTAQLEAARAEATAKAERLEATLGGMTDGVSMIDANLRLVEWNARFPDIAGIPPEILRVGLPMEELLRAQVATGQFGRLADGEAEVQRRMERLRIAPYGVTQRLRPDGRTIELRRNRLPDGGFVTLYADITEHKRAEEALRQAQAEAEAANAARATFMATVSHEIRTPLNTLLNTIRLISDTALSASQHALISLARQSGDALYSLVNDILEMTRAEAGRITIQPHRFELRPLLAGAISVTAPAAAERGVTFSLHIADTVPAVLNTDAGRLRQVLLNLLSNAAKYARPGDVRVIAAPQDDAAQPLRLTVRDPGPCIEPAARAALFQPFTQLGRPAADAPGSGPLDSSPLGSGLGLSISRHMIRLMGGDIGCEACSDLGGEGNAFWVTLPASALPATPRTDRPVASAPLDAPPPRRPPRTRILLVEDITANQLVATALLRREGHAVDVAGDAAAALAALRRQPYDAVFMDIFMPGMSGLEAAKVIRTLPEPARSVPVVALTANATPEDAARFRATGMNGALAKPVALPEMLDALRRHVWHAAPAALATSAASEAVPGGHSPHSATPPPHRAG